MPSAQAGPPADAARRRLQATLAPIVGAAGYDLEDLTVRVVGRRSLIRVTVDADDGVDLDAAAQLSHSISVALDDAEADGLDLPGPYVLEVTSPGVDRPLTEPRHWRRARGRLVSVAVDDAVVTGRVLDVDDSGVRIEAGGGARHVAWDQLGRGKVEIEFSRPAVSGVEQGEG
jgi:ribosome maturation factor RimP